LDVLSPHGDTIARIESGLRAAAEILGRFTPGAVASTKKKGGDPITEADTAVNNALRELLPRGDEGWLSEETVDDLARLECRRVWVVDPLDGTREFLSGIPEWCVSIGFVEDGCSVAGGVHNPQTSETFLGAVGTGVTYNGSPAKVGRRALLEGAVVLASRSEVGRGDWERYRGRAFATRPVGSVAYKLALVAAGLADATWTLSPKNEWDVAAGVALVVAGGGAVFSLEGRAPTFNNRSTLLSGLVACPPFLEDAVREELGLSKRL
jgi:myo-inositol-1(or 4)-monophosphatase